MNTRVKVVTVFGSSRPRPGDPQYLVAQELGAALAAQEFVVCSGGYAGTMEAVSRGAREAGGRTIGVTASFFEARTNEFIDQEIRKRTWQERLFALIEHGDAFVACPGGTGTLVELAVVWEMLNKNVVSGKPLVVLGDFWHPIIDRVREVELGHESRWGEKRGSLVERAASPADAAAFLGEYFTKRTKARGHAK
ncbi:MAG: LOG family protein [Candidatus Acidiferrales bacterium]